MGIISPERDLLINNEHFLLLIALPRPYSGVPNGLFRKITVRKAQNRLRYSDLVAVKARDFFGETSPRTFETRGVISSYHGGAKPPPKWVMKCPVFWLIFNNFVTFHHFFTKLGNLIWVFVPNNLT